MLPDERRGLWYARKPERDSIELCSTPLSYPGHGRI
jgi:hypothetical protein